jgi:hypothetical protein
MKFNKELLEKVRRGEATNADLIQNITTMNPLQDILDYAATQLVNNIDTATTQISVTMEEYERILGLFKIKGYKMDPETGELVTETRGRKPLLK